MGSPKSSSRMTRASILALCSVYVFLLGAQLTHAQSASGSASVLHPHPNQNATSSPTLKELKEREQMQRAAAVKAKIASSTKPAVANRLASTTKPLDGRIASGTRPALNQLMHRGIEVSIRMAINRLTAAAERLTNISGRIGSRIEKLSSAGADMTQAKALLASANQKIADAKAKIALITKPSLPTDPTAAGAREAYKQAFESTRAQVKAAEQAIKTAKEALGAVLKEIRKSEGKNPNAADRANASTSSTI